MILKSLKPVDGKITRYFLMFFLLLLSIQIFPQSVESIDLQKISQRKVRDYIVSRSFDQLADFSAIQPSWKSNSEKVNFKVIEETFYLRKNMPFVWDFYLHTNALKMWSGRSYSFALMICRFPESVIYASTATIPGVDTGQVYFLNLRLIKGLVNVPVAFEIINIDADKRVMEFSYIDKNTSLGKQTLKFFDDGKGRTRIVHTTYFKSASWLRDDLFYPYFHYRFIEEFHRNMKHLIADQPISSII